MRDQFAQNYAAFKAEMPRLLESHRGQHALISNGKIIDCYETSLDAVESGLSRFGENNFSVELIGDQIEDLGFFSHVSSTLQA